MPERRIAIRIGTEGKGEVQRDFRDMAGSAKTAYGEIGQAVDAADARQQAAEDRQKQRYARQAQAAKAAFSAGAAQQQFNEVLGVSPVANGSAKQSAEFFEAMAREEERAAAMAAALRAQLDPLGAAQVRLNTELAEYQALAKRGAISSAELAQAEALVRRRFDETTAAIQRQGGVSRQVAAARLNLARQGADICTMGAMGASPMMIAVSQGPQILDAMAFAGVKLSRSMLLAGGAVGVVATAVGVLTKAWMDDEAAQSRFAVAARGTAAMLGLNAAQMEALAEQAAKAGEVSVSSARKQELAYASTGKIGADVIRGLIAMSRDYQAAFGVDAAKATEALAKSFADPKAAAHELTLQIGLLDGKTVQLINDLVEQNRTHDAQLVLLDKLSASIRGAALETTGWSRAWDAFATAVSNGWAALGKGIDKAVFGDPKPVEAQIAGLQAQRARVVQAARDAGVDMSKNVGMLDAQITRLQTQLAQTITPAQRQANQQAEQVRGIVAHAFPEETRINALRNERMALQPAMDGKVAGVDPAKARAAYDELGVQIEKLNIKIKKRDDLTTGASRSLARDTAALVANTDATFDLAAAVARGEEAAVRAEARRKAVVDEARKGADADVRTRQYINKFIADETLATEQAARAKGVEAAARHKLNDAVAAGFQTQEDAERQMRDEAELRPHLIALAVAEGGERAKVAAAIERLKNAQAALNTEDLRSVAIAHAKAVAAQVQSANDNIARSRLELSLLTATNEARAVALAQQQAQQEIDARVKAGERFAPGEANAIVDAATRAALAGVQLDAAKAADAILRSQRYQSTELQLQIGLLGQSDEAQRLQIAHLQTINQLLAAGIDPLGVQGRQIVANSDAMARMNEQLIKGQKVQQQAEDLANAAVAAVKGIGKGKEGLEAGRNLVRQMREGMMEEAIWEPLKNFLVRFFRQVGQDGGKGLYAGLSQWLERLGRQDRSDHGGLLNSAVKFLGGNRRDGVDWDAVHAVIPFASGTDYAPGGVADVHQDERIYLPRGSKVERAPTARAARYSPAAEAALAAAATPAANDTARPAKLEFHYHGENRPEARATALPGGGTRVDVYEAGFKPMLTRAARDGTLGRAAGSALPKIKR